jgi:hypothetical protein
MLSERSPDRQTICVHLCPSAVSVFSAIRVSSQPVRHSFSDGGSIRGWVFRGYCFAPGQSGEATHASVPDKKEPPGPLKDLAATTPSLC